MLTIWTNTQFPEPAKSRLIEGARPHKLLFSRQLSVSTLATAASDPALLEADVAFGQPAVEDVLASTRLRWVHLTSAGYSLYDTREFRDAAMARGLVLTNSSAVYAEPCAEHAFSFMMSNARSLMQARDIQHGDRTWPTQRLRDSSRLLLNQNVVILGFGAIGRRLAEMLAPFSAKIAALRRKPAGTESVTMISIDELEAALSTADHVVNILPANSGTVRFVSARLFAAMKPGVVFYNIGRGVTVDQDALVENLRSGHVAAAYLDVADPEPLPPAHPLWTLPNCLITPHTAGGHDREKEALAAHFLDNLERFGTNAPLADRIL